MAERVDTTYTELMGAVLRARDRTRCRYLALGFRRGLVALIITVPRADRAGTTSVHMSRARDPEEIPHLVQLVEHMGPQNVFYVLTLAAAKAETPEELAAYAAAAKTYRAELAEAEAPL